MITLPNTGADSLRHTEADYLSILLDMMEVEYTDQRLITLFADESRACIREVAAPHIPVLKALYQSMSEHSFITLICKIVVEVDKQYGMGFSWTKEGKRITHDFKTVFNDVITSVLKG